MESHSDRFTRLLMEGKGRQGTSGWLKISSSLSGRISQHKAQPPVHGFQLQTLKFNILRVDVVRES